MVSRVGGKPVYLQIADALRDEIKSGDYRPGVQLPPERALIERFKVSPGTVQAALGQLRAEGLVTSRQGRGVFVRDQTVPRRLSTDIATSFGWYTTLARQGLQRAGKTTVVRAPCPPEAAEWLGIEPGADVTVRDRLLGTDEHGPVMLATSYFPAWVVEAAPGLADATKGGMPELLRAAFGATYSDDVLSVRMPSPDEQARLDLERGTPVQVIKGGTYDAQARPLHFIEVIAAGGRIEFAYRYGDVPTDS
jgi:GntR family transcriptional regulator